jgi:hypothetical protein
MGLITGFLGLSIAALKLRTFKMHSAKTNEMIYITQKLGPKQPIAVKAEGVLKYLGARFHIQTKTNTELKRLVTMLHENLARNRAKRGSPEMFNKYTQGALSPKASYSAATLSVTMDKLDQLNREAGLDIKRRAHLGMDFPSALLYGAQKDGGMGINSISDNICLAKFAGITNACNGTSSTRFAVECILDRHHRLSGEYDSKQEVSLVINSQPDTYGRTYFLHNLIEYLSQGNIKIEIFYPYKFTTADTPIHLHAKDWTPIKDIHITTIGDLLQCRNGVTYIRPPSDFTSVHDNTTRNQWSTTPNTSHDLTLHYRPNQFWVLIQPGTEDNA